MLCSGPMCLPWNAISYINDQSGQEEGVVINEKKEARGVGGGIELQIIKLNRSI